MRGILTLIVVLTLLFFAGPSLGEANTYAQSPAVAQPASSSTVIAAAATCSSPYTVVAGDTMTGIAQKCGVDYATLLASNGSITNPNLIFPGQTVVIPGGTPGIPNTGGQTYTVVAGDHLFRIAQRFGTTVQAILNVNPFISNPDLIFPGWVITLPAGSTPGIPNTGGRTYTVVSGDTLSSIAQRFGTTTGALMTANPFITNPDFIVAGWVLTIP